MPKYYIHKLAENPKKTIGRLSHKGVQYLAGQYVEMDEKVVAGLPDYCELELASSYDKKPKKEKKAPEAPEKAVVPEPAEPKKGSGWIRSKKKADKSEKE